MHPYLQPPLLHINNDRRCRDRMVVGFTTTYAMSLYHRWCCGLESRSQFVSDLRQLVVFSVSSEFVHQYNWPPLYEWTIVESGVKHHITKLKIKPAYKHKINISTTRNAVIQKFVVNSLLGRQLIISTLIYLILYQINVNKIVRYIAKSGMIVKRGCQLEKPNTFICRLTIRPVIYFDICDKYSIYRKRKHPPCNSLVSKQC